MLNPKPVERRELSVNLEPGPPALKHSSETIVSLKGEFMNLERGYE